MEDSIGMAKFIPSNLQKNLAQHNRNSDKNNHTGATTIESNNRTTYVREYSQPKKDREIFGTEKRVTRPNFQSRKSIIKYYTYCKKECKIGKYTCWC